MKKYSPICDLVLEASGQKNRFPDNMSCVKILWLLFFVAYISAVLTFVVPNEELKLEVGGV